ncbi:MAG: PAS domain-containing protein [Pseudomonadota bacterium]
MKKDDTQDLLERTYERIGRREVHQLEVQQVELELQNEQLEAARAWIEAALASYTELFDAAPVPYFTLNGSGEIVEVNRAGARLLGDTHAGLIERRMVAFVAAPERPRLQAFLQAAPEQATPCRFTLFNGRTMEMHLSATKGHDERRVVLIDVSEHVAATRHAQAFTLLPEALCIVGQDDVVEEINPACAALLGEAAGRAVGMRFADLLAQHPALQSDATLEGPLRRLR